MVATIELRCASYIEHCKNVLRQNGYVVLPKERVHYLSVSYACPTWTLANSKSLERFADAVERTNASRLMNEVVSQGFLLKDKRHADGEWPLCEHETIFTHTIAVIEPKEADA